MKLHIEHHTDYHYEHPLLHSVQHLRLTPQSGFGQQVSNWKLRVNGQLTAYRDSYGNAAHTLVMNQSHQDIKILASGEVETDLAQLDLPDTLPLVIYLRTTPLTRADAALADFAQAYRAASAARLDDLMHAIRARVLYQRGSTGVHTHASEAFAAGAGVCQDHAHIFIACCRAVQIPARYVSGYLFTEQGELAESHAWADAWIGDRWVSYDVSNGLRSNGIHVRLAIGLDYRDACPVSGIRRGGGMESLVASVQLRQVQQ